MSSGNGPPQQYSVSVSLFQRQRLLQLHQQADARGQGQRFVDAYREIVRRLQRDPRVFGEHLFTLPIIKLEIRQAAIHPLVVDYGIHMEQNIVLIQAFKMLG